MHITFIHSSKAHLPELTAYKKHLEKYQESVSIIENILDIDFISCDVCYRFGGFLREEKKIKSPEIHEYHSLSTGRWPKIKNQLKKQFSTKPEGRVFLNKLVDTELNFKDGIPYIYRDMGVDEKFYSLRDKKNKKYDIVYTGSISGRPGLISTLKHLSETGFTIIVAGRTNHDDEALLKTIKGVTYLGSVKPDEVPEIVSFAKFGLNYCPDIYPLNIQTSTKCLEYLAAGLPIISNKYKWIEKHSKENGYSYIDIKSLSSPKDLIIEETQIMPIESALLFEWENILHESKFHQFIKYFSNRNY